jgi:hypothetical protein
MSWFTDPNCEAECMKAHAAIATAVDFDFPSGHVRLGTWLGNLVIGGNTYLGVGSLGSIQETAQGVQLVAEQWSYQLSGVDPAILPESEIDNAFGRSVVEYEVWMDPVRWTVIGTEINREGTMGRFRRLDGGQRPLIEVTVDTRLSMLEQTDGWRYTTEHQAKFFSGDLGCDFARRNDSIEIIWGGYRVLPGGIVPNLVRRFRD